MTIFNFLLTAALALGASPEKSKAIATDCLDRELDLWERERGRLPNGEEADLIIEMCVKQAFEKEPKSEPKSR